MRAEDLKNAFGSTPASFREDVNGMLDRLEEGNMNRSYNTATVLAAVLLAAVLLAGTAVAAGRLGIFDRQTEGDPALEPLREAEQLVKTNIAAAENELVRLELEEALFDGRRALLLMRLTPRDPEHYALLTNDAEELPEGVYYRDPEAREPEFEEAESTTAVWAWPQEEGGLRRRDGKIILFCRPEAEVEGEVAAIDFDVSEPAEDGGVRVWCQAQFGETAPESARGQIGAEIYVDGKYLPLDPISYELEREGWERTARLEPVEGSGADGFELISCSLSSTPVKGLICLNYASDQPMGFVFRLEDGEEIPLGECWRGMTYGPGHAGAYECVWETQAFRELPETVVIEGWREGECLGRAECRVEFDSISSYPVLENSN